MDSLKLKVNGKRLWEREMYVGEIGADPRGGISRFAWTPEYRQACEVLMGWMREIGLTARMDTVGNIYGRLEGEEDLPPVLTGSHFDTVPCGGKFDGLAGIMTALEVLNTLKENGVKPRRPIEMIAFVNEEASQFLGGTFGSKAICGMLPDDYALKSMHRETGITMKQAMLEFGMGLEPDNFAGSRITEKDYHAFIELHIEQGKYLLQKGLPLAVIDTVAGIKQFYITIEGVAAHAGGMAMEDRHDAMAAAAAIATEVERLALTSGSQTRGTVGYIQAHPAEHNIIADQAIVPVDFREDKDDIWNDLYDNLMAFTKKECDKRGLTFSVKSTINNTPCHCDPRIINLIEDCATAMDIPHMHMISFPAHDSIQMGRLYPMGMIFLRSSNNGVSHCPEEHTTPEDLEAGANLLLQTVLRLANENIIK